MVATCDAPPASGEVVPHFSSLSILIDDVHGSTNVKSLRYMSPLVTTIYPREIPATGYEDITIRGEHFGNADQGQIIKASINGSLCEKTEWISSTEIKCRVPPGHTEAPASVIVSVRILSVSQRQREHSRRCLARPELGWLDTAVSERC